MRGIIDSSPLVICVRDLERRFGVGRSGRRGPERGRNRGRVVLRGGEALHEEPDGEEQLEEASGDRPAELSSIITAPTGRSAVPSAVVAAAAVVAIMLPMP